MATGDDVPQLLRRTTYDEIFERLYPQQRDAILAAPRALEQLREHIHDGRAPEMSRFLAAELLFFAAAGPAGPDDARALAPVYAHALATMEDGGAWGLPGRWDHPAAEHFMSFGEPALDSLRPLLSDARRIRYTGSKRASMGEFYGVRVKDVAAHIASRILGIPYRLDRSPTERDASIERLASRLDARQAS